MSVFNCAIEDQRIKGIIAASQSIREGQLVVLPTDTVYGIAADAFSPQAVEALLAAKGRGRDMPPPVLVGRLNVLEALAVEIPEEVRTLVKAYWPGPLTIILQAQPSLMWDLGETAGTVALRMPDHPDALELLRTTGPLAVSSANKTGADAATTATEALLQLGDSVDVYLDAGPSAKGVPSTIIDATVTPIRIVRVGAISSAEIFETLGMEPEAPAVPETPAVPEAPADAETPAAAEETPVDGQKA